MNKTIKQYAIETKICDPKALNDPEGYDGYDYYDRLSKFIELTKKYYVERELGKLEKEIPALLKAITKKGK